MTSGPAIRHSPICGSSRCNELKIDQTFVRDITTERGDERIVNALVDLAHTFDMRALAEGVETEEAEEILQAPRLRLCTGLFVFEGDVGQQICQLVSRAQEAAGKRDVSVRLGVTSRPSLQSCDCGS